MRPNDKLHVVQLLPRLLAVIGQRLSPCDTEHQELSPCDTEHQDVLLDLDVSIEKTITRLRIINRRSAVDRISRIGKVPVLSIAKCDVIRFRRTQSINLAASVFKLSDSGFLS